MSFLTESRPVCRWLVGLLDRSGAGSTHRSADGDKCGSALSLARLRLPKPRGGPPHYEFSFALVAAAVLVAAGLLRLGGVMDLVSKPVVTGFLFGLGLTVAVGQLSKVLGVEGGSGHFFELLGDLVRELDHTSGLTLAVGAASIAALIALAKLAPALPGSLIVLAASIALSALSERSTASPSSLAPSLRTGSSSGWPPFAARRSNSYRSVRTRRRGPHRAHAPRRGRRSPPVIRDP
jgi:hypothetical protein